MIDEVKPAHVGGFRWNISAFKIGICDGEGPIDVLFDVLLSPGQDITEAFVSAAIEATKAATLPLVLVGIAALLSFMSAVIV